MRRLGMRPLTMFAWVSLALCCACLVLWARSHWGSDEFTWQNALHTTGVATADGEIYFFQGERYSGLNSPAGLQYHRYDIFDHDALVSHVDADHLHGPARGSNWDAVACPLSVLIMILAIPAAGLALLTVRRRAVARRQG